MYLSVSLFVCVCEGWSATREEEESWAEAQHVLHASSQTAYVGIMCVVYSRAFQSGDKIEINAAAAASSLNLK